MSGGADTRTGALPWGRWLAAALALGLPPHAFWALSVAEWRALVAAHTPDVAGRATLEALLAAHPDTGTLKPEPTPEADHDHF